MKNVTIALDEDVVNAGREYARQHHTSLNNMIRELLERTVMRKSNESACEKFFELADKAGGDSRGWRWNREELYDI
ncbi:MAG: DUF6364 family protein [Kiritimatiellia bacterium]